MDVWDKGVFMNELLKQGMIGSQATGNHDNAGLVARKPLTTGTFHGTSLALVQLYSMAEEAYDAPLRILQGAY